MSKKIKLNARQAAQIAKTLTDGNRVFLDTDASISPAERNGLKGFTVVANDYDEFTTSVSEAIFLVVDMRADWLAFEYEQSGEIQTRWDEYCAEKGHIA
jgi:hypothetical protein